MKLDAFLTKVWNLILNPLIEFLFAVAVVLFLYGIVEFIWGADSEEARTKGRSHMLWGVVGIAIMIGVWSILHLIEDTFGLPDVLPR